MFIKKLIKSIVFLCLFISTAVFSDTVTLKSGKKIKGKILDKTDRYIKIEVNGKTIYFELKDIADIEGSESEVTPAQENISLQDTNYYLKAGLKYSSQEKFIEAEEEFKKGLAIAPADHNLQEVLKMIDDLKNGKIEKEYALYLFKGSDYLINGKNQEAIKEFKSALEFKPDNRDLYYYIGVCNYSLEQYEAAIDYLKKAIELKPDSEIYYYLGASHYSIGQHSQAIAYLQKVLETNPDDAEAYSIIGTSYYLLGESEKAKANLDKAKESFEKKGDYLKAKDLEEFLSKMN